jgi:hypothetical protein
MRLRFFYVKAYCRCSFQRDVTTWVLRDLRPAQRLRCVGKSVCKGIRTVSGGSALLAVYLLTTLYLA